MSVQLSHFAEVFLLPLINLSSAFLLFLQPVNVVPSFSQVMSFDDLKNPLIFLLLFYILSFSTVYSVQRFPKHRSMVSATLPVFVYSFVFLNFWIIKSPVPFNGESILRLGNVQDINQMHHIVYSLGYLQYPGIFLVTSSIGALTGLPVDLAGLLAEVLRPLLISLFTFCVALRVSKKIELALLVTILSFQADIMLSNMPAFQPESMGLELFLISILASLLIWSGNLSKANLVLLLVLLVGTAISYSLASAILGMLFVVFSAYLRSKDKHANALANYVVVGALSVEIFSIWNLLFATQIPSLVTLVPQGLSNLFALNHYFNFVREVNTYGAQGYLWTSATNQVDFALLFAIPSVIVLCDLIKRRVCFLHVMVLYLFLFIIGLLLFIGGADWIRILYYAAPFTSMILMERVFSHSRAYSLKVILLAMLVIFSFPSFLSFNINVNTTSNYTQTLDAGNFAQEYISNAQKIFDGSGIIGYSGSFYANHFSVVPESSFYALPYPDAYRTLLWLTITEFRTTPNAMWSLSSQEALELLHFYGPSGGTHIWTLLMRNLTYSDLIYQNSMSEMFYP